MQTGLARSCGGNNYNPALVENMERSYVSANFIRNKSSPSNVSNDYAHYSESGANNPPSTSVYVRLDPATGLFVLSGKRMPRLVLTRGKKYQFNVVTPGKPFYLFGSTPDLATASTDNGRYTILVDNTWPAEFFYGCANGESSMTGKIVVK